MLRSGARISTANIHQGCPSQTYAPTALPRMPAPSIRWRTRGMPRTKPSGIMILVECPGGEFRDCRPHALAEWHGMDLAHPGLGKYGAAPASGRRQSRRIDRAALGPVLQQRADGGRIRKAPARHGVAVADPNRDAAILVHRREGDLVGAVVAEEDRPASRIGRLLQEGADRVCLGGLSRDNLADRLAELKP